MSYKTRNLRSLLRPKSSKLDPEAKTTSLTELSAAAPYDAQSIQHDTWQDPQKSAISILVDSKSFGARPYIVFGRRRITFEEHYKYVSFIAQHFVRMCGIKKGDRIAIAMRNSPEWILAFWAALSSGAIVVPLNAWWARQELEFALNKTKCKILIADAARLAILEDSPELSDMHCFASGSPSISRIASFARFENLIERADLLPMSAELDVPDVDLDSQDPAVVLYTSGTTGIPKGALVTHGNIVANLMNSEYFTSRGFAFTIQDWTTGKSYESVPSSLVPLPLFHVGGCVGLLIPALIRGSALFLMEKWEPNLARDLIREFGIAQLTGVPTMLVQLLESIESKTSDFDSLTSILFAGSPASPELLHRLRDTFPNAQIMHVYGMTEASGYLSMNFGSDLDHRPESVGCPPPGCEFGIADPSGNLLPPGAIGEIWARGPNIISEYWENPEANAESFVDGWFRTGDLGRQDDDGYLYIVGRVKDVIIRGGENVYANEVERVLMQHPSVIDAGVVGLPDEVYGEIVGTVIQMNPQDPVSAEALKAHVREHLAYFKVPAHILCQQGALPRNTLGKLIKAELKVRLLDFLRKQSLRPAG